MLGFDEEAAGTAHSARPLEEGREGVGRGAEVTYRKAAETSQKQEV